MNRRKFLQGLLLSSAGLLVGKAALAAPGKLSRGEMQAYNFRFVDGDETNQFWIWALCVDGKVLVQSTNPEQPNGKILHMRTAYLSVDEDPSKWVNLKAAHSLSLNGESLKAEWKKVETQNLPWTEANRFHVVKVITLNPENRERTEAFLREWSMLDSAEREARMAEITADNLYYRQKRDCVQSNYDRKRAIRPVA